MMVDLRAFRFPRKVMTRENGENTSCSALRSVDNIQTVVAAVDTSEGHPHNCFMFKYYKLVFVVHTQISLRIPPLQRQLHLETRISQSGVKLCTAV